MVSKNQSNIDHTDKTDITSDESVDAVVDDIDAIDIEAQVDDKLKKYKQLLSDCKLEQQQLQDELQRARADFLNTRRRLEAEQQAAIDRSIRSCLNEILPLCDSFQMAMSNTDTWNQVDETWRKGIEGIHGQLLSLLQKYRVVQFDPLGKEFDPALCEAVGSITASDEFASGTIAQVLQSGYLQEGNDGEQTLLRPARVIVAE